MIFDVAILGSGIAPYLAGMALGRVAPDIRPVLVTTDREIGGGWPELVPIGRLPEAIVDLCRSALVNAWDGGIVVSGGAHHFVEEPLGLIQPAQLWLEIDERLGGVATVTSCGDLVIDGPRIQWSSGHVDAGQHIDLRGLSAPRRSSELVDEHFLADLKYPVVADFDVNGSEPPYLQYVPLGTGLTMLTRVHAEARLPTVGPPDLGDLPTIEHIVDVASACATILSRAWQRAIAP